MPFSIPILLGLALCVIATSVWTNNQGDCNAGIARLQAEIDKGPEQLAFEELKEALRNAKEKREEGDFDWCKVGITTTFQDLSSEGAV